MTGESFIDVESAQQAKAGQLVCGDVFLSQKIKEEGRVISVLSDGLGSGIKAGVLATLTATMALKYTAGFVDVRKSAKTIMDTLPICEVRKISYSTFTIVDLDDAGRTRIIEHGNPPVVLLRGNQEIALEKSTIQLEEWKDRLISYSQVRMELGDRLVCFSDGVSQSGMGRPGFPLGWGREAVGGFIRQVVTAEPEISSGQLSRRLVERALANDGSLAKDDVTAASVYFRHPRRLLVMTGPPFARERDGELAELVRTFPGRKVICGGTTASIVERLLGLPITMDLTHLDPQIPPTSSMEGVDLITEGTLTLGKVGELLDRGFSPDERRPNGVWALMQLLLESDMIEFVVGTRINEAHQDPNIPVELDLRRNIVRRIVSLLESKYLKAASLRLI